MRHIRTPFFYGWVVVAAVFLILSFASGVIYAFSSFFDQFQAEFGASRAQVSFTFAACEFIWFATGTVSGPLTDRYGAGRLVFVGSLVMAAGLVTAGLAHSLAVLYLSYGIGVGVGGGLIYVPAISSIQRWFKKKRGLASGIAVAGIGIGTLTFPLLAVALSAAFGWRGTHYAFAAIAALLGCGASLFLVSGPQALGLGPDGSPLAGDGGTAANPSSGVLLGEALVSRGFWHLYVASFAASAALFITLVHLPPYAHDHGYPKAAGATLLGILGIASVCGRFVFGSFADLIGRRRALSLMYVGLSVSMLWWLACPPALAFLIVYAASFGVFYGGYIALLPSLAMDHFGGARISSIIGFLYTSAGIGALTGPFLAGFIYDLNGSYAYAILCGAILMAVSAVSCFTLRDPEYAF